VSTTNASSPGSAYRPRSAVAGDLNNDGKIDLYFAGYGVNDNIISLNQSSGTLAFGTPTYITAVQAPGMPALGDLNEDGNLDVVQPGYNGGNGNAGTVLTRMGFGNGTFDTSNNLFTNPVPGQGSQGAAIADVNGDGNLDVIAAVNAIGGGSPRQGAVITTLGNGNGTFQMPATVSLIGANSNPASLLVVDINGDGHLDVITNNGGSVSTLLGNGTATFATGTVNASMIGYSLSAADLNGDGFIDLATADWYGNCVNVALGNGDGTFDPPSTVALPSASNPYSLALADMNGDGLKDIIAGTYTGHTLSVMLNTSVATAPTVTGVAPATGSTVGGTSVTISGTGFTGASAVTFGGVNASSFTVNSPTSITAIVPPHAAGTVSVAITTANGTGTGAGLFTYTAGGGNAPAGGEAPAGGTAPAQSANAQAASSSPPAARQRKLIMNRFQNAGLGLLRSTGVVPDGADRVIQTATRGAGSNVRWLYAKSPKVTVQKSCSIAAGTSGRTFTCSLNLAPGRWTVTTQALAGSTAIARSVTRVRVKAKVAFPVTG
jgi:hypothetical protein